ncbi:MAG: hypothetical protein CVV27_12240 [Candidatus Melainabacteria bacterium HGW-Melainabacteria-1]|nr:MAG: hypothetical protein CVV27_12240 [Candidatus Melainabacteria bacterium HGW-Melainabacteria-1]
MYYQENWNRFPENVPAKTQTDQAPELTNLQISETNQNAPSNVLLYSQDPQGLIQVDPQDFLNAVAALGSGKAKGSDDKLYLYNPTDRNTIAIEPTQEMISTLSQLAKTSRAPLTLALSPATVSGGRSLQQELKEAVINLRKSLGQKEQVLLDIPPDLLIEGKDGKRYRYAEVDGQVLKPGGR